jgi:hydrogenase nickel incorporation protein HypA/HybF
MHEYSIVSALVDRVQREADRHPGAIVRRLHLKIGELAGVEIELLRTAFDTFRPTTVCGVCELAIDRVAARWGCPKCGNAIAPPVRCSKCDTAARLASGDEIILERIELEVPDV